MRLTYVGPHDGVDVALATRDVTVMRGESEEFAEPIAESLLAQGPEYWIAAVAPRADETARQEE